jgi:hypothetical protein
MTTYTITPEILIADLLREFLSDPRTSRESTRTQTLSAGSSTYTLTPTSGSVQSITSLKIGGVTQKKWKDYFWDWQNQKIILPAAATGSVVVIYKQGTAWIYPDKPNVKLSEDSFPRISVFKNAGVEVRFGQYNAPMESTIACQIDMWIKSGFIFTDANGFKYEGEKLASYISNKAKNALTDNEENLYSYGYSLRIPTSDRSLPYDEEYQAHHKLFIIEFNSLNEGEITI